MDVDVADISRKFRLNNVIVHFQFPNLINLVFHFHSMLANMSPALLPMIVEPPPA
jgi:hypothetical protein